MITLDGLHQFMTQPLIVHQPLFKAGEAAEYRVDGCHEEDHQCA